jgi:hypothetical protein
MAGFSIKFSFNRSPINEQLIVEAEPFVDYQKKRADRYFSPDYVLQGVALLFSHT